MEDGRFDLENVDPEVAKIIREEFRKKTEKINLIASENYTSAAVLEAQGSILTDKYAEGYPGCRYYSGCEQVDEAETLAIERAKALFGCEHANVQPHAGSQANMAVYICALEHGDTLMAMDLTCGGHLSHGSPVNFSGMYFKMVYYGVDRKTEVIDYDRVAGIARAAKPRMIIAGGSSYPRCIDFAAFREIADSVGALLMADMAHFGGLVVGKVHPDPVPHADFVTGTTHKTLRGPRGGFVLTREAHARRIDEAVFPGTQGGPFMHSIAAKAVCFMEAMKPEFAEYQKTVVANCRALCDRMAREGFRIVSGGTDTHLFLIDLRTEGITGHEAQEVLCSVGINANKNVIPYDEAHPAVTSGLRIGTPAVTTRGMRPEHMDLLGGLISRALRNRGNLSVLEEVRSSVRELADGFPVYPGV